MKKDCLAILSACLLSVGLCGCKSTSEIQPEDFPQVEAYEAEGADFMETEVDKTQSGDIPELAENSQTDVVQGGPYGEISLSLPAGWSFKECPMDSGDLALGMYGIQFYPENVTEGYIEVAYANLVGVCGTGLESEKAVIAGNPASISTYDGHEYWDFISFQGNYEGIVAVTASVDNWWSEYHSQVLDILNTLSFQMEKKEGGAFVFHEESEINTIGLSFSLKNISPVGATLVFCQYNPGAPTGELEFGDDFKLETLKGSEWEEVPIVVEGDYGFNGIAYNITPGENTEKELDWEWLYGKISAGEYRICKEIFDFREPGDFDKYIVYAYFILN